MTASFGACGAAAPCPREAGGQGLVASAVACCVSGTAARHAGLRACSLLSRPELEGGGGSRLHQQQALGLCRSSMSCSDGLAGTSSARPMASNSKGHLLEPVGAPVCAQPSTAGTPVAENAPLHELAYVAL